MLICTVPKTCQPAQHPGLHRDRPDNVWIPGKNVSVDLIKGPTINLLKEVSFGPNDNLRYTYDTAGNKLVKVVDGINAENNTRLDYSVNFLYENNELKAIFTSAGRIVSFDNNGYITIHSGLIFG